MKRKSTLYLLAFLIACWALPLNGISQSHKKQAVSPVRKDHHQNTNDDENTHFYKSTLQQEAYFNANPEEYKKYLQEQNLQKKIFKQLKAAKLSGLKTTQADEKYIFPVVFHVFGNIQGGKEITYEIIENALQQTNEDYAGLSIGQQDGIHERFKDIVDHLNIEFRLAKIDPNGHIVSGVNFYPEMKGFGNGNGYDDQVQQYAWDNYKYLNIYIMNDLYDDGKTNQSGVAWYPSTSMSDRNLARVVFNGAYIGTNSDENFRRILTHEIGHYFNLIHPFDAGCPEKEGMSDYCDDTPIANKANMGVDELNCYDKYTNTQNFMNYTDDYQMFTNDQVTRMEAAMTHDARKTLYPEENLLATGVNDGFDPMYIKYTEYGFKEALINDGSVDTEIPIELIGGAKFKTETFVINNHFKLSPLPDGLVPEVVIDSDTKARVIFTGKATKHEKPNSVSDMSIEFLPAAFTNTFEDIYNTKISDFRINFRSVYETKYIEINHTLSEKSDFKWFYLGEGDGEYGMWYFDNNDYPDLKFKLESYDNGIVCHDETNDIMALNYGDEIGLNSSWHTYDQWPNQPDIYNENYSDWAGRDAYIGIKFTQDDDVYHGWISASISDDGARFTLNDAAYYTKPDAPLLAGRAHETMLKFDGDTLYEDQVNNNGSIENVLKAKLMNCNFALPANTKLTPDIHYTLSGLPVGLVAELTVLENEYLSLELKAYAENHNSSDNVDISISFKDALFDGIPAADIKGTVNHSISTKYLDEYQIVFKDIEDLTVNAENPFEEFFLDDYDYHYGAWFNEGLCRFETYEQAVVGYDSKYLNAKPVNAGEIIDGSRVWSYGQAYPYEIYLTSPGEGYDEFKGTDTYIGLRLVKADLVHYGWIHISMNETGSEYTVLDWAYNEQPLAPIIAGETTNNNSIHISVAETEFVEPYSNDGSLEGCAEIQISGDQFAFETGTTLTQGSHYRVNNLPEGLRPQLKITGKNEMELTFQGNALQNTTNDDGEITFSLNDNVFTVATAATVINSSFGVTTHFKEPWDIIYTDLEDMTASESNTFSWFGMEVGSHGFGAWWYNKNGQMKLESYENYVICHAGTINLKPLNEGAIIGYNSEEWYQGLDYPDEPDLDNTDFHEWRGQEAYVGVRLTNGEFHHFGWIRISVAADGLSYTVYDQAFNNKPGAPIVAGQKTTGDITIIDMTHNTYRESYENDGSITGENTITIGNGQFSVHSGLMQEGTHYEVANLPAGLQVELSAINADSLKLTLSGKATNNAVINNADLSITFKEAAFEDGNKTIVSATNQFDIRFRDEYSVIYVDIDDVTCSADKTWTEIEIIPGLYGIGAWCYQDVNFKMESYDNKVICHEGTYQIKLLEGDDIIDGNTAGWTSYDKYPNQLDVYNNSYTDWKGKEGYVGLRLNDGDYYFYAWVRISVAADGQSYQILDYAYNEKPGEAIFTGAKQFIPILPVVDFATNKTSVFKSESVTYQDLTSYEPMAWNWNFEGGTPASSNIQNPVVTYAQEGVYSVSLTATNKDGEANVEKPSFITVYEEGPAMAAFTADKDFVKMGETIQFTDASLRIPTGWTWTFEGGTPTHSSDQNPMVTYNTPGTYKVSLTAENSFGLSQEIKEAFITVQDNSGYCIASAESVDNYSCIA
ncbi:MAG: PKD domain-containing protein, partial [Marinilabiliaceae bacterium]|nr:PKD domain-containing protein [Marinilabiliaceae bacterium]